MKRNSVMLTFDLEEFDIPEEYGQEVSPNEQMNVTRLGMERLMQVIESHNIPVTFFTTGNFADHNREMVFKLSQKHEIASHAFHHSPFHKFSENDIVRSKSILESITGKLVSGFRMPRLQPFDRRRLTGFGIRYDSSINPTYIPGRYNLLNKSAQPYIEDELIELPCSTTQFFRFPLFWLSFKNLPIGIYSALCKRTLRKRNNLMLYFHPWEFADLTNYQLPAYVKSPDGDVLARKLDTLITELKKTGAEFCTCGDFVDWFFEDNRLT